MPAGHEVQLLAATALVHEEYLPAPQSTHKETSVLPNVAENLPAPQLSQPELPAVAEYLPAWHCWHSSCEMEPFTDENVPRGQFVQALSMSAPERVEYLPQMHRMHVASEDAPVAGE